MSRKFNVIFFGPQKERIKFVHFKRPKKNGLAGMVQGNLFSGNIGILVNDEADYAELFNSTGDIPFVRLLPETFYGIKNGNIGARTALFHELGHCINGDHKKFENEEEYYEERTGHLRTGVIMECEIAADDFAVKYLGAEYVARGLEEIMKRYDPISDAEDFDQEEQEYYELAQKELRLRIDRICNKL